MGIYFKLQIIGLLSLFWQVCSSFMCLDSNANHVDWYSLYKTPKIHHAEDWKIKAGLAQFYLDVHAPQWALSSQPMNSSQQEVAITLEQIYKPQSTLMYIMYNDESPVGHKSNGGGHTKGVVAFDETSGFWLVHSVPKFPPRKADGYAWPDTAVDFGQTFLCVSLPYKQLGIVAKQLLYNQPDIYDSEVPQKFVDSFPVLQDLVKGKRPPGPPWSSIQKLTSVGGQSFLSFAKANYFHADLYDALVAPTLKQNLYVETWLRASGTALSSNCSASYKVLKVDEIALPNGLTFHETKDHAKWAVTTSKTTNHWWGEEKNQNVEHMSIANLENWVCVGDINRMESQFKRGGGTLCIQHVGIWKAYTGCVSDYVSCP